MPWSKSGMGRRLMLDHHAVVCRVNFDLTAFVGHVFAEMGQDQPAAVEVIAMFAQLIEAEMEVQMSVLEGAFADE